MKKTSLIITGIALALAAAVFIHDNQKAPLVAVPTISPIATTTSTAKMERSATLAIFTRPAPAAPAAIAQNNVTLTAGAHAYGANISGSESVLTLMRSLSSATDFKFTGEDYPSLGFFVESIDGVRNADGKYWILYINGKSADVGASNASIKSGDTVEWRFEKSY